MGIELTEEQLLADLRALGISAEDVLSVYDMIENYIRDTATAEKRPVSLDDISSRFGMTNEEASKKCSVLKSEGKIHGLPKRGTFIPAGVAR